MNDIADEQRHASALSQRLLKFMALMKQDLPASLELLSDDVRWVNHLPSHIPFGGEYLGREGFCEYIQCMSETFEIGDYPLDDFEFIESGDTLVVVGYEKQGRVIHTGKVVDLPFVWVVKFDRQGRIRFLQEHNDTAAIGDAFRS